MIYSEAAYFNRDHCAHCVTREDHERELRIRRNWNRAAARARITANREWGLLDGRPLQQRVRDDLAACRADPEWCARVNAEWDALP